MAEPASGQSVQRYYDPAIGRFLSVDPVGPLSNPVNHFGRYHYAANNPYRYVDPDGRYFESAIEIASLGVGIYSLKQNIAAGNTGAAILDGVGIVLDGAALAVPIVPGGVGLGIKAGRALETTRLADDALVVRGGSAAGANSAEGLAKGIGDHPDGVTGFSAESANGASLCDLCANVAHNQVGVTTVGQIRAAGGDVVSTGGASPTHATVTGLSPEAANSLLTPTRANPVPKDQRRQFDQ